MFVLRVQISRAFMANNLELSVPGPNLSDMDHYLYGLTLLGSPTNGLKAPLLSRLHRKALQAHDVGLLPKALWLDLRRSVASPACDQGLMARLFGMANLFCSK